MKKHIQLVIETELTANPERFEEIQRNLQDVALPDFGVVDDVATLEHIIYGLHLHFTASDPGIAVEVKEISDWECWDS